MASITRKEVLTTGQVARLCHVAPRTVSKWVDTGQLRGYRIPGSRDRRIPLGQVEAFMRANGIPLPVDGGVCRVMILGDGGDCRQWATWLDECDRFDVRVVVNGFEAGAVWQQYRPHVIVVDVGEGQPEAALGICRAIRGASEVSTAKLVAAVPAGDGQDPQWYIAQGFDACIVKPIQAGMLVAAVQKVMQDI